MAAGSRFAAAVPDVQITAAGTRVSRARPSAVKPATRSSMRTLEVRRGEREGLRARAGRDHDIADTACDEFSEKGCRSIRGRR
jgi:hypothetical protein